MYKGISTTNRAVTSVEDTYGDPSKFSWLLWYELKYWKKFHIQQVQQNALIRIHYDRSQNTLLIWRQLLYVSAPTCHHQGVFLQKIFVGPTNISGTTHSHFQLKSYKPYNVKTPHYTSTLLHQQYHTGIGLFSYIIIDVISLGCVHRHP